MLRLIAICLLLLGPLMHVASVKGADFAQMHAGGMTAAEECADCTADDGMAALGCMTTGACAMTSVALTAAELVPSHAPHGRLLLRSFATDTLQGSQPLPQARPPRYTV
ncbi:hypothetical protein [uncultured Limimaricola sp.]|uniref:hypothetical protein n=1 Tax=uncultured Limimaricola sp. TaxID=2211667 RepID=UPI0030F6C216